MRSVNFSRSVKVLTAAFKQQSAMIAARLYSFDKDLAVSFDKILERFRSLESSISSVDESVSRLEKAFTRLTFFVLCLALSMFLVVIFTILN